MTTIETRCYSHTWRPRHGVTERTAAFDRRHVIQDGGGLVAARSRSATEILDIADAFLASEQAIPLARTDGEVIRLRGGRIAPAREDSPATRHRRCSPQNGRCSTHSTTVWTVASASSRRDVIEAAIAVSTQPRRRPGGDGASDLHVR